MAIEGTVLALVGSNPLPMLLAVRALDARRVVLLHTDKTLAPAERLRGRLGPDGDGRDVVLHALGSATDPKRIRGDVTAAFDRVAKPVHLHYTGGTKTMAVQSALALQEKGVGPDCRSYLDDSTRQLVFDDGRRECLPHGNLDVDEVFALHGWKTRTDRGLSGFDVAQTVATLVDDLLVSGERVNQLRDGLRPRGKACEEAVRFP